MQQSRDDPTVFRKKQSARLGSGQTCVAPKNTVFEVKQTSKNHPTDKENIMTTQKIHYLTGTGRTLLGALALVILAAFVAPQVSHANTAANAIIRNTVTVNYDDAGGTPQTAVTDFVDVTINLVEATPALNAPTDISITSDLTAVYNYTLTATANGPDTYDLSVSSISDSAGFTSASTATLSAPSLNLGGTTVATAVTVNVASDTTITVPSDGASGGPVNGIQVGDVVVLGGFAFTVNAVDDTNGGTPNSTSTITVDFNGNTPALSVGDVIGEQQTFTVTVDPGNINATVDQTVDVDINARDDASAQAAATDSSLTTVQVAALTLTKTADVANAAPGDIITYTVTIDVAGTTATSVTAADAVPAYTTLVTGVGSYGPTDGTGLAAHFFAQISDGTNTVDLTVDNTDSEGQPIAPIETGFGNAAGTAAGSALNFYIGDTSDNSTGGTVATTTTYTIEYKVMVD